MSPYKFVRVLLPSICVLVRRTDAAPCLSSPFSPLPSLSSLSSFPAFSSFLSPPPPAYPGRMPVLPEYGCGGRGSVAISGKVAAMGCRGWESVFIFNDVAGTGAWAQTLRLASVDYRSGTWLGHLYEFPAQYGAAVALYQGTLVVGSPTANYGTYPVPDRYDEVRSGFARGDC